LIAKSISITSPDVSTPKGSARLDRAIFWTIYAQEKPNEGKREAGLQFMQFNNPIQNNK